MPVLNNASQIFNTASGDRNKQKRSSKNAGQKRVGVATRFKNCQKEIIYP